MSRGILQPQPLCEQIAERIREQILCGEIRPGEPVSEAALVAQYSVSRTPVREALRLLQNEGLLTAHVRRGMVVTVLDDAAREEALALHRLLSGYVRERATATHVPADALSRRLLKMVGWRLRLAKQHKAGA